MATCPGIALTIYSGWRSRSLLSSWGQASFAVYSVFHRPRVEKHLLCWTWHCNDDLLLNILPHVEQEISVSAWAEALGFDATSSFSTSSQSLVSLSAEARVRNRHCNRLLSFTSSSAGNSMASSRTTWRCKAFRQEGLMCCIPPLLHSFFATTLQ